VVLGLWTLAIDNLFHRVLSLRRSGYPSADQGNGVGSRAGDLSAGVGVMD
jgi:hypothetical protein